MKKRGLFRNIKVKEDKDHITAPVIVVESEEQKALIDRITRFP
jgi:hypothetical protein